GHPGGQARADVRPLTFRRACRRSRSSPRTSRSSSLRALHPGHPRTGCRRTARRPLDPAEVPRRALSRRPSHFPGPPRLTGMSENQKTRIEPLSPERAPWWVRLMYRYARRRFGEVPEPFTVAAHHPGLLLSSAVHETLLEKTSSRLPANVRELAVYWTARKIG